VADIHLRVMHTTSLECRSGECDAFGIGSDPRDTHQLAPRLQALATPTGVERLIAQHRSRVAEPERKWPVVQLRRDDASDADGPLTDEREQRAVRVHEAEEP